MMKFILKLIFFFAGSLYLNGQTVFLPNIGTKWHYAFRSPFFALYNVPIEYIKDSLYQGETVKVLRAGEIYVNCTAMADQQVLIRQRNDSIWFLHAITNHTWQLLIDYNAQPGQSWSYQALNDLNQLSTHTVTVNATGTTQINSLALKTLSVSYTGHGNFLTNSVIYERIGEAFFLFPIQNDDITCDSFDRYATLCYEDNTLGLKQFTHRACDFSDHLGIESINSENARFNIYPNPAKDFLELRIKDKTSAQNYTKLSIHNNLGQMIQEEEVSLRSKIIVNTQGLESGVYFLRLTGNERTVTEKFVISR